MDTIQYFFLYQSSICISELWLLDEPELYERRSLTNDISPIYS